MTILDNIVIELRNTQTHELKPIYIDVLDSGLGRRWLAALNQLLADNYHLEKNYCFFGFADSPRNGAYICDQINQSIQAINSADLGYTINDEFTLANTLQAGTVVAGESGGRLVQAKFNQLHRYFEDLQGVNGAMSSYYTQADVATQWHIRQLNLLCHEFESWALSARKQVTAPDWQRPSQLMCWLNAPRFALEEKDLDLFGIDTLNRSTGGVYLGVNKAIGKHHYEVFNDEGRDSRIDELTTSTLRAQTLAAGDFDIEWAQDPSGYEFQQRQLQAFRTWLTANGFDPEDKSLTIGHPKLAQVDLIRSFGTEDYLSIWSVLNDYLDVYSIKTSQAAQTYNYTWADPDFKQRQINILKGL